MRIKKIPFNSDLTIKLNKKISLSSKQIENIENFWQEAQLKNSMLFDGSLYFLDSIKGEQINLVLSSYKYHLAFQHLLSLRNKNHLKTLAITSACLCVDNYFILGQRSKKVSQDQGCWEFSPSGSFEPDNSKNLKFLDAMKLQVRRELKEEMGVSGSDIKSIEGLFFIEDIKNNTIDTCSLTTLNIDSTRALKKVMCMNSPEYKRFRLIKNTPSKLKKINYEEKVGFISEQLIKHFIDK